MNTPNTLRFIAVLLCIMSLCSCNTAKKSVQSSKPKPVATTIGKHGVNGNHVYFTGKPGMGLLLPNSFKYAGHTAVARDVAVDMDDYYFVSKDRDGKVLKYVAISAVQLKNGAYPVGGRAPVKGSLYHDVVYDRGLRLERDIIPATSDFGSYEVLKRLRARGHDMGGKYMAIKYRAELPGNLNVLVYYGRACSGDACLTKETATPRRIREMLDHGIRDLMTTNGDPKIGGQRGRAAQDRSKSAQNNSAKDPKMSPLPVNGPRSMITVLGAPAAFRLVDKQEGYKGRDPSPFCHYKGWNYFYAPVSEDKKVNRFLVLVYKNALPRCNLDMSTKRMKDWFGKKEFKLGGVQYYRGAFLTDLPGSGFGKRYAGRGYAFAASEFYVAAYAFKDKYNKACMMYYGKPAPHAAMYGPNKQAEVAKALDLLFEEARWYLPMMRKMMPKGLR